MKKSKSHVNINNATEDQENDNILDIIREYTNLYINSKISANLSIKTIYNAKVILERFHDYIADEYEKNEYLALTDLSKYFLNNYLSYLNQSEISANTQKLHLTVIKNFLILIADTELDKYGALKNNLWPIKIKTEQKEKPAFTQSEQKLLLDYIAQLDTQKNYLAQRNALLIKVLLYTGARISELVNIKWVDVVEHHDDNHGYIYVILLKGKGNKERYTYLLYNEIKDNLEYLANHKVTDSPYLFVSTHGNQCNRSSLFDVVKNLLNQAGIHKSGLHIFRHTFARTLVDKNVNLATIKDLLGHTNITITAQFHAKSNEGAKRKALFMHRNHNHE
jgi:integrase/recombinase XerD